MGFFFESDCLFRFYLETVGNSLTTPLRFKTRIKHAHLLLLPIILLKPPLHFLVPVLVKLAPILFPLLCIQSFLLQLIEQKFLVFFYLFHLGEFLSKVSIKFSLYYDFTFDNNNFLKFSFALNLFNTTLFVVYLVGGVPLVQRIVRLHKSLGDLVIIALVLEVTLR